MSVAGSTRFVALTCLLLVLAAGVGVRPDIASGQSAHKATSVRMTPARPPYVSGPIENGMRSPWRMTPEDPAVFPRVGGPAGGKGIALVTTPSSFGPNSLSYAATRWLLPGRAHAGWGGGKRKQGQDTWYRVRMMFPAGRYSPTRGEWNWVVEWHNDDRTARFPGAYSIALGVYTDYSGPEGEPGQNPRLALRLMGGDVRAPEVRTIELPSDSLLYDHWYDLTFHIVWSADPAAGLAEWWCDGVPVASQHFPTLYTLPDGTHSFNGFGVYNYRLQTGWPSEVHVGDVGVGPTARSVGAA